MAEASDTVGMIYQNLRDAGCDAQTVENCMTFVKVGQHAQMLPILFSYRATLLETIRCGQRQIDCLDYLIYKIQKK